MQSTYSTIPNLCSKAMSSIRLTYGVPAAQDPVELESVVSLNKHLQSVGGGVGQRRAVGPVVCTQPGPPQGLDPRHGTWRRGLQGYWRPLSVFKGYLNKTPWREIKRDPGSVCGRGRGGTLTGGGTDQIHLSLVHSHRYGGVQFVGGGGETLTGGGTDHIHLSLVHSHRYGGVQFVGGGGGTLTGGGTDHIHLSLVHSHRFGGVQFVGGGGGDTYRGWHRSYPSVLGTQPQIWWCSPEANPLKQIISLYPKYSRVLLSPPSLPIIYIIKYNI